MAGRRGLDGHHRALAVDTVAASESRVVMGHVRGRHVLKQALRSPTIAGAR
jgi:hypothetical protein